MAAVAPQNSGRPQIFPGGCLSLPIRVERKAAARKQGTVGKSTAVLSSFSLSPTNSWLALNNDPFLHFPFPWHLIDTSILAFRLHQKTYGCYSVRSLCVPGTVLSALCTNLCTITSGKERKTISIFQFSKSTIS